MGGCSLQSDVGNFAPGLGQRAEAEPKSEDPSSQHSKIQSVGSLVQLRRPGPSGRISSGKEMNWALEHRGGIVYSIINYIVLFQCIEVLMTRTVASACFFIRNLN
jgi:hypothetical protein